MIADAESVALKEHSPWKQKGCVASSARNEEEQGIHANDKVRRRRYFATAKVLFAPSSLGIRDHNH
jgi:hypothetical protein